MSVQVCPGCQGRNSPQAETCEWCGRSFDGRARGFSLRWWHVATALLFGFVAIALTSLVILSASRLPSIAALTGLSAEPAASPQAPLAETALPTPVATPALALATPKPAAPSATPTPVPPPSPTAPPARYVRVANTTGLGVFLREDPGLQGQRINPAVPEGAVLRLVGPEETVQAQIWRLCEHEERSIQGWVLAQYLQAVEITPAPTDP